jgi:thiol:disulfide interchange protein DsbD
MKPILNLIFIFLLTSVGMQTLHAADYSKGASLFSDSAEEQEFLSPDIAFKLNIKQKDATSLNANFKIEPGYYLYKQRIQFKDAAGQILTANLPQGDIKDDPNFGKQEVYHHDFTANILLGDTKGAIKVNARYQGCSEKGLCYAPQTKEFNIAFNEASPAANIGTPSGEAENAVKEDRITRTLKSGNLWLVFGVFFVTGLLLSFTPCVLPMIPILSGIIVGSKAKHAHHTHMHGFLLSLAYVLGMALSYTIAGIVAGLSGSLVSQSLQNPWVLGITALLFVLLALSMFGWYELKLPQKFEEKLIGISNRQKRGQFAGVFSMGIISALILSPCVSAPLAGALVIIGKTGQVLLGGVALFSLSLGMGVPLLLLGASAGSIVPKTGHWMILVRNGFGVLMLLMAAYIAWPILPHNITQPINKALGMQTTSHLPFQRVKSVAELDAAVLSANGKTVMLDFYADWCTSCKEMEKFTFSDKQVQAVLKNVVLLQADVTANNADDQALLKRFNLFGPPGIIFFDATGNEIKSRVIGYKNAEDFTKILNQVFNK